MGRDWPLVAVAVAVLVTALAIVYVRHEGRRAFIELQALEAERDALITGWRQLQLEQATWADGSHVEAEARGRLGLEDPRESRVLVVLE